MLPNIVEHSYRVCQLACFLGRALNQCEARLDLKLLLAASLLHDITKTRSLRTKESHADTAEGLLVNLGYPEVGEIVGCHVELGKARNAPRLAEVHIVNYSDRRVLHDRVVSIDERFAYLLERYGHIPEARQRMGEMKETAFWLEGSIFSTLGLAPDRVKLFNSLPPLDLEAIPPELRCWVEGTETAGFREDEVR
jgi:hypothetical protein